MVSRRRWLLLLGVLVLLAVGHSILKGSVRVTRIETGSVRVTRIVTGSSSSPHSLRHFYTVVSEPGHGLPRFSIMGYMDDQLIVTYDSRSRRVLPRVSWMEEFGKKDPQYWKLNTQLSQVAESAFRVELKILQDFYNEENGTGFHILQSMFHCEVGSDGQFRGGKMQYAYNGEDFIALDLKTLTWTAYTPQALATKNRWENDKQWAQYWKSYLEGECVDGLQRHLDYGKESLQRKETPTVRVTRKAKDVDLETLDCHVYGFYPKEIDVTWMKDGVDQISETFIGGVVPNLDGTYRTWRSIDIDPKERGLYRCRVEHDSLKKPLDLAWEKPASPLGLILGILVAVLAVTIIVGVIVFLKRYRMEGGYRAAPRSDQGSDNSVRVSIPEA